MAPKAQPYRAANGHISWFVRFRVDGKQNPVKETFSVDGDPSGAQAKVEAERFARLVDKVGGTAARATRRTGEDSARDMPTLRTWFEQHLASVSTYTTTGTPDGYRKDAERTWLPHLGHLPLDAITRDAVVKWVAWQREQETARSKAAREKAAAGGEPLPEKRLVRPKTIKNAHGLLSSTLQAAVDADPQLITRNPAKGVRLPSDQADTEKEILTHAEWELLRAAIPAYWLPLTTFLIVTGVRIGEASAVQMRDLDLDSPTPTVRIRRAWKKGERDSRYLGSTKSRRGVRTIRIGTDLADLLRPLVTDDPEALVFTGVQGGRVQAQHFNTRVWKKALADAGITKAITPHGLRHTSASWMLMAGVAPQVVQHRLGHESLSTTSKIYAHLLTDAQADAATLLDAAARPSARQIEGG